MKQRRFRPRPIGTLLAVISVGAFMALGLWQIGRVSEKESLAEAFEAQRALPPLDVADHTVDIARDRYRAAVVKGAYEQNHQILVDNVVLNGKPGFKVFAPLRTTGGDLLLVDRGWIAQPRVRGKLPRVPVTEGEVTVSGWLDHPRSLPVIIPGDIDASEILWPYLDMDALSRKIGAPLPNFVIHMASDDQIGLMQQTPEFEPKTGMHIGYAIQWFAFAAFAAGTYIAVSMRKVA